MADGNSSTNTTPRRTTARVNGELVGKAPRSKVDKRRWNDDIAWLLTESRGELGERGMAIDPAGGGSRNPADTGPLHDQRLDSMLAVEKWRRHWGTWEALSGWHQRVLLIRYRDHERRHTEVVGLRAAFGDLAGLAWHFGQELTPKLAVEILRARALEQRRARTIDAAVARWKWGNLNEVATGAGTLDLYLAITPEDEPALIDAAASDLRRRMGHWKPGGRDPVIKALKERVERENRDAHLAWLDIERNAALDVDVPRRSAAE